MKTAASDPRTNHLLAALPCDVWQRWMPQLDPVELQSGKVLYESGATLSHVYFPTTAIISLQHVTESGATDEIAVVGHEGVVGISIFMAGTATPNSAFVQSTGEAFRLRRDVVKDEFHRSIPVMHLLLRYTQALITQMGQIAVCNRHHSLHQQLARLLLMRLDRLQTDEVVVTQEQISNMLGVRREGVTEAALELQRAGVIRYARGHIHILDRAGLEQQACECYGVVKREYGRLLPDRVAT